MISIALVFALALPQASAAKPSPQSSAAAKKPVPTATLEMKVTDRLGAPLAGAEVRLEGPSSREGTTDSAGVVIFRNMTSGTYRARVEREGFHTFEKEAAVKAGAPSAVEAALSPAPAPPPPPPAPAPPEPLTLLPGLPRALAISDDLVRKHLPGKDPIERLSVGCSGATASEILRLRDALESHSHTDADEVLYLVAGEATLNLGGQELTVGPGWYSLVPRGTSHGLVRRGRNPIVLLSVLSGPPCPASELKD